MMSDVTAPCGSVVHEWSCLVNPYWETIPLCVCLWSCLVNLYWGTIRTHSRDDPPGYFVLGGPGGLFLQAEKIGLDYMDVEGLKKLKQEAEVGKEIPCLFGIRSCYLCSRLVGAGLVT